MSTHGQIITILRNRREALGMSQRQLAKKAGFTQSMVSDYERGVSLPTLGNLVDWADSLGCVLVIRDKALPT